MTAVERSEERSNISNSGRGLSEMREPERSE